jgi:hypothetical protein
MPRLKPSPVAIAFLAYRTWVRLPREQRRQLLDVARRHGPTIATKAAAAARQSVLARLTRRRAGPPA